MKIRLAGVIALLLLAAGRAGAADYYVSPTGNNGDPGSSVSPWQTVTYAAQQAQFGDIVHVTSGTYNENGITFANPGVTVAGEDMPVIESSNTIFNINRASITITGLYVVSHTTKVVSNVNDGALVPVILLSGGNTVLSNNTFSERGFGGYKETNPEQGGFTPGIYICHSDNNVIQNNVIETQNINSPGIVISGSTGNTITGNHIDARHSYSIRVEDSDTQANYDHNIDTTNTGYNNAPIYYLYNQSGTVLNGVPADEIIAAYCSNITVRNINMYNAEGIMLAHTSGSTVTNFTNTRVSVSSAVAGTFVSGGAPKYYTLIKSTLISSLYMYRSNNNVISSVTVSMGGRHNYVFDLFDSNYNRFSSVWRSARYMMGLSRDGHNDYIHLNYAGGNSFTDISSEQLTWGDYFFYFSMPSSV